MIQTEDSLNAGNNTFLM